MNYHSQCKMVRIIIPIHPPKLNFLVSFLKSIERHQLLSKTKVDIVLAVTNSAEGGYILRAIRTIGFELSIEILTIDRYIYDTLQLPGVGEFLKNGAGGAMAVLKKIAALHWASKDGDLLNVCVDADTFCMNWTQADIDLLISNYNQNSYFGSTYDNPLFSEINKDCLRYFDEYAVLNSARHEKCSEIYTWFFDVPTYRSCDLEKFFTYMVQKFGSLEAFLLKLRWHSFEHILFIYFRVFLMGGNLINYSEMGVTSSPENLSMNDVQRIASRHHYFPSWVSFKKYFEEPDFYWNRSGPTFLFHFDRV